jgi:hypothetical protein
LDHRGLFDAACKACNSAQIEYFILEKIYLKIFKDMLKDQKPVNG